MKLKQYLTLASAFLAMIAVGLTAAQDPVNLRSAADYVILAKADDEPITTTPGSLIVGDLGISPAALSTISGFGQTMHSSGQYATSSMVDGRIFAADMGGQTAVNLTQAVSDMETAYTDAASRSNPDFLNLGSGALNSTTQALAPGLYKWTSSVTITDSITIDGGGDWNAVWIFQIDNRLTLAAASQIILVGNANPANIFWQTAEGVTIGANSQFVGNVLTMTDVAVQTDASLLARLLAQTAVTLQSNDLTVISDPAPYWVPGFGYLTPLGKNRYGSNSYGTLSFADGGADESLAWSESLGDWLQTDGNTVHSSLYGTLTPNPWGINYWVVSEFFGLVHFGWDASHYDGWVNSERFDWMKFVEAGNGQRYLWVHRLQTWLAVNPNGTFHSFDFGWMIPQSGSLTRYDTRIGMVTADASTPRGWLVSEQFGFVWFARDGTAMWFWSERRNEWIGITANGGLWSTAEERFLE